MPATLSVPLDGMKELFRHEVIRKCGDGMVIHSIAVPVGLGEENAI